MGWPADKLDVLVELGIDGQWTPSAQDVYGHDRASIEITRGRSNLASRPEAGRCSLQFNNRDGKYSPRNPRSPYFGKIGRNTPLRVWAYGDKPYLWIPGGTGQRARVASSPSLDVTEDLDVRIELSLDYIPALTGSRAPQFNELVGRYNATGTPGNRSWRLMLDRLGQPDLTWSTTGDDFPEVWAAGHPVPYFAGQRFALRATLDVDNGAGGHTVTFYTAPTIGGPWTMLGDPITNAGVTSIHPPGDASLEIGDINTIYFAPGQGRYYALQLRDGIDGPLLADPDFTAQADYTPEFTDGVGNLWQMVGGALIEPYYRRFVGEVSEWPQRWQGGGVDAWTDIEAAGALRRYRQGAKPLQSTLRRRIPSGGDQLAPLSYWPMEEGRDATQAYSPLPGVGPLHTTGLNWDSDSSLFGSDSLPTLGKGASLRGNIGPGFIQGGWTVDMSYQLDKLPDTEMQMMRVLIAGGPVALAKVLVSAGGIRVVGYDSDNNIVADITFTDSGALAAFTGGWNRLQFASAVSGDRTYLVAHWRNVITGVRWFAATSYAGGPGVISSLATYFGGDLQGMAIGHIGMWGIGSTVTSTSPLAISPGITYFDDADDGFESESAVNRLRRLADEEDLPLAVQDGPGESEHLGPQQVATLLDNIQDAADADGGLLLEQRETLGLQYRQRETLYNRPPALVLDYTVTGEVEHPFEPVDDDSELANDRTVTRRGGSSGRAVLETGPLSVQAPPDGVGVYDDSVTLSLASDAQAAQIAGWRLHLGTVDEARYPRVTINLRTAPQLIEPVMSLDVGDIIQVINLPEFLPPGPVLLRVEGYTETINAFDWKITFNCSPASPWTVGTVAPDDPVEAGADGANRADTSGCEVAVDAAAADTVLVVHTPQDGDVTRAEWVTAGHIITPNPTFESSIDSWSPFGGTEAQVPTPQPAPFPGSMSYQLTPDGVTTSPNAFTAQVAVTAGQDYVAGGWLRCATGRLLRLAVNWYGDTGYLSTSSLDLTVDANVWTRFDNPVTAPAGAVKANLSPIVVGTATAADVLWVDQAGLRRTLPGGMPAQFPFDVHIAGELVRVASCEPRAWDSFDRTVTGGWGTMTSGKAWNTTGGVASDYSVDGATGQITLTADATALRYGEYLEALADCELLMLLSVDQDAVGGDLLAGGFARAAGADFYWCDVVFQADGTLGVEVRSNTAVVDTREPTPYTYGPGDRVWLRMRTVGDRVLGRVWPDGTREPGGWHIDRTITVGTSESGTVGVAAASTATNTDAVISVHEFRIVDPQQMTVTRAVNGVVKDQLAGADVRLAQPAVAAL